MKTRNILTLLVLAVFAFSFSTAHSQEKKTKKEQEAQNMQEMFSQGDFLIFRASYTTGVRMSVKGGLDYNRNQYTSPGLIYGTNLRLEFVITGEPKEVFYDVKGKCKSDILYMYSGQEGARDATYLVGYSKGKDMIQVYEVVENQGSPTIYRIGNYPIVQVYGMDDYPDRAAKEVELYNTYGAKVLRIYNR